MIAQVHALRSVAQAGAALSQKSEPREPRGSEGLVKVRSAYPIRQTVERLKRAIASKGIPFFGAIDQARLAADVGVRLRPSTLLVFGNPTLGAEFLSANPYAGLDWPVRLLVLQDSVGVVWVAHNDFAWIARRRGIADRQEQFALAAAVVDSITSSVRATAQAN